MDDHFTNNTSAPKAMSMFRLFKKKKSVYFLTFLNTVNCVNCRMVSSCSTGTQPVEGATGPHC